MKKFVLNGIVLFLIMFVNCSFVFSEYIAFVSTPNYPAYCYNAIPGGTFQLQMVGSNCANTYDWSYNSGSGWYSISSSCTTGTSVTQTLSYPSSTTTYRCLKNGDDTTNFVITVYSHPNTYTVSGGNCCGTSGDVTLSGSYAYLYGESVLYYLYKNGVYVSFKYGTGSSLTWLNQPAGIYTVKAYFYNGCNKNMSGSAYIGKNCCKGTEDGYIETLNENDIKVYPNPNSGSFYFETEIPGVYTLYDELGREFKVIVITGKERIELSGLKPGLYFIRDESGNNISKISVIEP